MPGSKRSGAPKPRVLGTRTGGAPKPIPLSLGQEVNRLGHWSINSAPLRRQDLVL